MKKTVKYIRKALFVLITLLLLSVFSFVSFQFDAVKRIVARGETYDYKIDANCESKVFIENKAFSSQIKQARDSVSNLKQKFKIPGLSICIAKDNEIIWYEGFGCSDVANRQPVDSTSLFRVGSISKSMSAIALLKLVSDGKITLDQEVHEILNTYPKKEFPITIAQVASHQSGIRHYKGLEMISNKEYNSIEESLSIFKDDALLFEPGTDYKYSSYNYTLLSRIIEVASGIDYLSYMKNEVFIPLNMQHTLPDKNQKIKVYSTNVKNNTIKNAIQVNVSNKWAGGGLLSTPKDIVTMMIQLDILLPKIQQKDLFEPAPFKNGKTNTSEYAIGFRKSYSKKSQRTLMHHGGSAVGGRAFLLKVMEDNIVIAICANNDTGLLFPSNYDINEVFTIAKLFIQENQTD